MQVQASRDKDQTIGNKLQRGEATGKGAKQAVEQAGNGKRKKTHARHILYVALVVGMLIYALPRLTWEGQAASWFSAVWLVFALVVIAANLHRVLGVDEETSRQLARVKAQRWKQLEQRFEQRAGQMERVEREQRAEPNRQVRKES